MDDFEVSVRDRGIFFFFIVRKSTEFEFGGSFPARVKWLLLPSDGFS